MTWERGRADIDRLIAEGELDRVAPSDEVASRLLADADAHIVLSSKGIEDDPAGALQLGYDAAHKASAALLAVQGLRATTRGGTSRSSMQSRRSSTVAAWRRLLGLHPLRRRRNRTEYPDPDSPGVNEDDARQALETPRAVVDAAKRHLDSGRLDQF